MNAIQPSTPPLKPVKTRSFTRSPQRRSNPHKVKALETTVKIAVNVCLSAVAVAAVVKLLAYQKSQQVKLQEINAEVQLVEERVNHLQTDFKRYFDPHQAKTLMQEESNRLALEQRQVILLDKTAK